MSRTRSISPLCAAALAVTLAACASTSALVTGAPRPPIDPAQVRVYHTPPPGYEEIARLDTRSGAFTYGAQNKLNSVIDKLRREAAKLGANGVLFLGAADGPGGGAVSVGAGGGSFGRHSYGGGGVGVSISPTPKHGHGLAIHVPNPPAVDAPPPAIPSPTPTPTP